MLRGSHTVEPSNLITLLVTPYALGAVDLCILTVIATYTHTHTHTRTHLKHAAEVNGCFLLLAVQ